jgi:hypothetical protein
MKLTEAEYQKLRPIIIRLSQGRGHPSQMNLGEMRDALRTAGLDASWGEAYEDFVKVHFTDLPANCESAVTKILERLEQEVFDCTGKYPDTSV